MLPSEWVRWTPRTLPRHLSHLLVSPRSFVPVFRAEWGRDRMGLPVPFLSAVADHQRAQLWRFVWGIPGGGQVKRKEVSKTAAQDHAARAGLDKLANFAEWMTSGVFEDGSARQAPTVTVWCSAGEWKCNLRDRAEGLCLWLSADTWAELVKLINDYCQASAAPWRVDDGGPQDGKRLPRKRP